MGNGLLWIIDKSQRRLWTWKWKENVHNGGCDKDGNDRLKNTTEREGRSRGRSIGVVGWDQIERPGKPPHFLLSFPQARQSKGDGNNIKININYKVCHDSIGKTFSEISGSHVGAMYCGISTYTDSWFMMKQIESGGRRLSFTKYLLIIIMFLVQNTKSDNNIQKWLVTRACSTRIKSQPQDAQK